MTWEKVRFGDLYSIESRNGLTKPSRVRGSGYKMINMGELFSNDKIYDIPMEYVPLSEKEKLNFKVEKWDLLFARQSLVLEGAGKCSIVMEVSPLTVFESHLIRVRLKHEEANPIFYYYYFKSSASPIKSIVSQCAQAGIRGSDLQELTVSKPPLSTQNKIASILSAYDDLIENNKKQIKLLEEAAQRLYKEWFVDLRFPGHENVPVVDGVPAGWERRRIKDIVTTTSGGTPSRGHAEYYRDGTFFWIKTKELDDGFIFETEEMITEEAVNKSSAKVLKPGSIVLAMYGATIGKLGITTTEMTCNQACCVFDMSSFKNGTEFLFCWLLENRNFLIHQGKGVAQPNLSQEMIKNFEIIIPDIQILKKFSSITSGFFALKSSLQKKILLLKSKREATLPKLMSGELKV